MHPKIIKDLHFGLFFLLFLISDDVQVCSNVINIDMINKNNKTICFRSNDAPESNVIMEELNAVDKNQFYGFLVKIGWTSASGEVTFHCGGTLISDKFVLSAAHCMNYEKPMYKSQPDLVRIAERLNRGSIIGEDIHIESIYIHSSYRILNMYHDIALIKLRESSAFQPVCIWTGNELPISNIFALGHDLKKIGNQQIMNLKFISNSECDNLYSPSRKLPNGIMESQFCAGRSNITEKEKCKGYIGGPLLTQMSNMVYVVGLTNFGQRCASIEYPNIYTKLSFYTDWMVEIIK